MFLKRNFWFYIWLSLLLVTTVRVYAKETNLSKELPADALELLNTFPKKAVTLDLVLKLAVQKSDSFKILKSEVELIDVPLLEAQTLTPLTLTGSLEYTDNRNAPINPFSFIRQESSVYSLGVEKKFITGTTLSADVTHNKFYFELPPGPFVVQPQVYQSLTTLKISQSLLKDAFGASTKSYVQAAELSSEASRFEHENKVQTWSLDLAQIFFEAWLAQKNYEAQIENLKRRQQILNLTQIKFKRGTSERPDILQALTSKTNAELLSEEAFLSLKEKWRGLVMTLKLPSHWMNINPALIPLEIEDESHSAKEACNKNLAKQDLSSITSYELKTLEKLTSASKLKLKASKYEKRPTLDLYGSYAVNGVDIDQRSTTFSEMADQDFPAWSVGLRMSYPLGDAAQKSKEIKASVDYEQSKKRLQESKDQLRLAWYSFCDQMELLRTSVNERQRILKQQNERRELESRRFNIGRVSLLNVIQSGDDHTLAWQSLLQAKANLQLTALKILALDQKIFPRIENYIRESNHETSH